MKSPLQDRKQLSQTGIFLKNIDTNTIPKSQLVVKVLIVLIVDQVLRKLIMNKYLKILSHAQRKFFKQC